MSYQKRMPDLIRVDTEDLKYIKGNTYIGVEYSYQGKPFTGFRLNGYYDNDEIVSETQYVNGEQIGWVLRFYDNGQLERETLSYSETTVFFQKFDREGKKTGGGFVAPIELLKEVCEVIGEDPETVKVEG